MACRLFGAKPLSQPIRGLLSIGPLETNFGEISIKIQSFSFTKMQLKISSVKWRPFRPVRDEFVLIERSPACIVCTYISVASNRRIVIRTTFKHHRVAILDCWVYILHWGKKPYTVRCRHNAVNFYLKSSQKTSHSSSARSRYIICGVLCGFKPWWIFCLSHWNYVCHIMLYWTAL